MKKSAWLLLFFVALAADLLLIFLEHDSWRYLSKPFIVVFLLNYFVAATGDKRSQVKKWLLSALIFSVLGDILLLFDSVDERYFLLGLSSFLVAHILYILMFHQVRILEGIRGKIWLLLPVAVYYAFMITLLSPRLGAMKIPVQIYAVVISFMLMLALHMVFITNKKAGKYLVTGAALFVLSDSLLAINKFYHSFEFAGISVMLTYAMAQLFIVLGVREYLSRESIVDSR